MTYDFDDAAYRELEAEAAKDNRVGDHLFVVTDVIHDTWQSGDPRCKIKGILTTAGSAKADFTLSPPPSPEEVRKEMPTWDTAKKKAIAASVSMHKALAKLGKNIDGLGAGDEFGVKTAKNKDGFIRVVAILDPAAVKAKGTAKADHIPF